MKEKKAELIHLDGLDDLVSIRNLDLAGITDDLRLGKRERKALLEKSKVTAKTALDLSLRLGIALRQLVSRNVFEGEAPFRHPRPYETHPDMDGYFGQIGLRLSAGKPTAWFPLSDDDREAVTTALTHADDAEPVLVQGLGWSSILINPVNLPSITMLPEAADGVDGDFEISPFDPVEGFDQPTLELLGLCGTEDGFCALDLSSDVRRHVREVVTESGGWDVVEQFLSTADIHYADGTVDTLSDGTGTALARDLALYGPERSFSVTSDSGVTRFINMDLVAYIRFPNLIARFASVTDIVDDADAW